MSDKQPVIGKRDSRPRKLIHHIRKPTIKAELPQWNAPASVDAARSAIDRLIRTTLPVRGHPANTDWDLEKIRAGNEVFRSNDNNRYLTGRYIAWARRELGRGHFNKWVREHLTFEDWHITVDGARSLMALASRCTDRGWMSVKKIVPSGQAWWTEAEQEQFHAKLRKIHKRQELRKLRKMEAKR